MKTNGKTNVYTLCTAGIIAAIYVALTLAFAPISFGPVQLRISEMLCILPAFTIAGVPGVAIGCLLANLWAGAMLPDVVFGTLATLIGAAGTYWLCNGKNSGGTWDSAEKTAAAGSDWMFLLRAALPPIVSNAIIVPLVLKYAYHLEDAVWFMVLTVGAGEVLAVGVLGGVLLRVLKRYRSVLFVHQAA